MTGLYAPLRISLAVFGFLFLTGCSENPGGPSGDMPVVDPDGLLWVDSGWKGFTAVDLKQDTVYEVLMRVPAPTAIAAGRGCAFAISIDGYAMKISSASRQVTDSAMISGDAGVLSPAIADADNLWVIDVKAGRPTRLVKIDAADLDVLAVNAVQTDSCTVSAVALSGGELWLYHTNPPLLARANPSSGAIDAAATLSPHIDGRAQLGIDGRTAWVLSAGGILVKVNLDTRTVTGTYDLNATIGANLAMAVSPEGVFVGKTNTTPLTVHKLSDDYLTPAMTFESADTSLQNAKLTFLRAKGTRLIAVVARGYYNQYAEIDVPTMTLKRGIGGTYCYGMDIE